MKINSFSIKMMAITLMLSMVPVKASTSEDEDYSKSGSLVAPADTVKVGEEVYVDLTSCYALLRDVETLADQQDTAFYPLTQACFDQAYSAHCKVYAGQKETVTGEETKDLILLFVATESLLRWQGLGCIQRVDQGEYEENSYVYQPAEMGRIMAAFSQENIERMRLETPPSKNCETFMEAVKQIVFLQGDTLDEDPQEELPLSFFLTQGTMMGHSLVSLFE
jgi:hypothetical protein